METLGLDRLIDVYLQGNTSEDLKKRCPALVGYVGLQGSVADQKLTLETMADGHKDLSKSGPDNLRNSRT